MASLHLEMFKWKSDKLANFRCPICGDSTKNKYKARGYMYEKRGGLNYSCHNCNVGMTLSSFLKKQDPMIYRQYVMEKFQTTVTKANPQPSFDIARSNPTFSDRIDLPTIASLSKKHPARAYLENRKIPEKFFDDLYWAEDFKAFSDLMVPEHGKKLIVNDSRIIIPLWSKDGKVLQGYTGRTIDPNNTKRYMVMMIAEQTDTIYGLDKYDDTRKGYVTEGPLDSMFLDNAVAVGSSDLTRSLMYIPNTSTMVFDNDFRNSQVVSMMRKAIEAQCHVFIWPDTVTVKDCNEYISLGNTPSELMGLIDTNTFTGLQAKLKLSTWSKS